MRSIPIIHAAGFSPYVYEYQSLQNFKNWREKSHENASGMPLLEMISAHCAGCTFRSVSSVVLNCKFYAAINLRESKECVLK